jgi:hypothetical protein
MLVAAAVALAGSVAAVGMTALQALANPSGTFVTSVPAIVASGVLGIVGAAAFGTLWLLRNIKRSE